MNPMPLEYVEPLLTDKEAQLREMALVALRWACQVGVAGEMKAAQQFHTISLRLAAARALWRIEPKHKDRILASLLTMLREDGSNNYPYSGQQVNVLAVMGPDAVEALPALVEAFRKGPHHLRLTIINAIRKIDPKGIARLRPESRDR